MVLLILDEFPVDTLTRPGGQIDVDRYPGFASLARTSTWFRGGHAVYDSTTKAVPAILDGRSPRKGSEPGYAGHPDSIFTLLAGLGYGVVADESVSPVCPPAVCPDEAESSRDVLAELREAERPVRLRGWIDSIRPRDRPTLYVHHALLPHEPWIYLPSGRPVRPPGHRSRSAPSTAPTASATPISPITTSCGTCFRWASWTARSARSSATFGRCTCCAARS